MVARVVRYAWRHRRREYRLGTRVDADQPRSQTGGYTPPHSAAEWGDNHGQVTLRVCRLVVRISADIWPSFLTAMSRSSLTLRVRRVISSADCDPVCRCVCCLLSARREAVTFLHARFSFPSPGTRSFLCEPIASCHVAKMLFSVREHLASHWPDLAEGRLRLDRLNRNGVGETFFPWACHPARKRARDPGSPIPREARKSHHRHPPLRCGPNGCGVDRRRLSDRHRGRGGRGLANSKEK